MLRRNDDSIAKQAQRWTPQDHGERQQPKNTWKKNSRKNVDNRLKGFKYRWRKMEAAAEDRAEWRQVVCGRRSTGSDKA